MPVANNITKESGEMYMRRKTRRLCAVLLSLIIAIQMVPIAIAAPGEVEPMIAVTTAAHVDTANSGDEFMVHTTIEWREEAAGDIGWVMAGFNLHYDSTRLELIPQNELAPPGFPFPVWAVLHFESFPMWPVVHGNITVIRHLGRVLVIADTRSSPTFENATISFRFRVRDDAPSGEALISHTVSGNPAGIRSGTWGPSHSMPYAPTNPLTDFARVEIFTPMLAMNAAARVNTASPGDEFVVDITIEWLPTAGPIGWTNAGFRIYYDSTRLELIPYAGPWWVVPHPDSTPLGPILHSHLPQYGRINFIVPTFNWMPAFDDGIISTRFRVRDDAPSGEAWINYVTLGAAGNEVGELSIDMPFRPPNPPTDFARVSVGS